MRFLALLSLSLALAYGQLHANHDSSSSGDSMFESSSSSSRHSCWEDCHPGCPAYAAGYSNGYNGGALTFFINTGTDPGFQPIPFTNNQPDTPLNIIHNPYFDPTTFKITKSGVYLVGWTLTYSLDDSSGADILIQLWDNNAMVAINPSPFQAALDELSHLLTASGQTLVFLEEGTLLQLRATTDSPTDSPTDISLGDQTLFITHIAD